MEVSILMFFVIILLLVVLIVIGIKSLNIGTKSLKYSEKILFPVVKHFDQSDAVLAGYIKNTRDNAKRHRKEEKEEHNDIASAINSLKSLLSNK